MTRRLATLALALVAALSACSADEPDENAADKPARALLVAALGDSITAGSPLWDPDEEVRAGIGEAVDPESQYEYWAQLALGGQATFRNCGVFGERTDEIAARLDRCSADAQVLIVQGGINDIAQGRPVEDAAESLRGMVQAGKKRGLRVALVDVLPWNNGYPRAAGPIDRLNRLIDGIGEDEDVPVYAFYDRLEDPRKPHRMKREWTIDGNHPSVKGYRRLAETVELP